MNKKLIRRAAYYYRRWMINQTQNSILLWQDSILSRMDNIITKTQNMSKLLKNFFSGVKGWLIIGKGANNEYTDIQSYEMYNYMGAKTIPCVASDTTATIQRMMSLLKQSMSYIQSEPISLKQAIEEISVINDSWPEVDFRDGILCVKVKNISLDDGNETVKLGDFHIELHLNPLSNKLDIVSIDKIASSGGYYHPHVSTSNKLCSGAGADLMEDAINQGRLEDYFRIVEAILRTYNEQSPYNVLNEWYNPDHDGCVLCESCDTWIQEDNISCCARCELYTCDTCIGYCECKICGEWCCSDCYANCKHCDGTICNVCFITCCSCNSTHCPGCSDECPGCNMKICSECANECSSCGKTHCSECLSEQCSECEGVTCGECETICSSCDRLICSDCHENECDHCGIDMCSSCEETHKCILEKVNNGK